MSSAALHLSFYEVTVDIIAFVASMVYDNRFDAGVSSRRSCQSLCTQPGASALKRLAVKATAVLARAPEQPQCENLT